MQKQKKKTEGLKQELTIRGQDKNQLVVQILIKWLTEQYAILIAWTGQRPPIKHSLLGSHYMVLKTQHHYI